MYSLIDETRLDILVDLYDETTIDAKIVETDEKKVIRWINIATRRSTDFTEAELEGTASAIRLASCKYNAYSIMSTTLEGHDVETDSLAKVRLAEAKELVQMYCNGIGIVPAFDMTIADGCVVDYAYAVSTDANSITG